MKEVSNTKLIKKECPNKGDSSVLDTEPRFKDLGLFREIRIRENKLNTDPGYLCLQNFCCIILHTTFFFNVCFFLPFFLLMREFAIAHFNRRRRYAWPLSCASFYYISLENKREEVGANFIIYGSYPLLQTLLSHPDHINKN